MDIPLPQKKPLDKNQCVDAQNHYNVSETRLQRKISSDSLAAIVTDAESSIGYLR